MLVEPWVFGTITFDFAHFKSVHHFHMSDVNVVQQENKMYWAGKVEITDKGKEFKGLLRLEAVGTEYVVTYMKEEGKAPIRHMADLVVTAAAGRGIFSLGIAEHANQSGEDHS